MVYAFNPLEDARWLEFINSHPRASVFHTPDWLQALRRTYGYQPIVYTTSPPGAALTNGMVFCRIDSWLTGHRMVSLPFADHCEPLVEQAEDRDVLFGFLRRALQEENWKHIEVRPLLADVLGESGLEQSHTFCLHVLDLRPDLEVLFRNFQKDSIQRKVKRAEREGLGYEQGRSEEHLDKFYRLMLQTRRRHKLPPQPLDWFRSLIACLGERLKIHVASNDGRPIASIVTLRHGDTLVYKYGCSDANHHNLGGMPFLFWKAIKEAKERGMRSFDLGRTDLSNSGLITFKNRLGASQSVLAYGRFSAHARQNATEGYHLQFAKRVFACLPDGLLTVAGRLLYRHIG
jgi:CelD/BcsL family acetyltransferase involved in cellulose biosynthesis